MVVVVITIQYLTVEEQVSVLRQGEFRLNGRKPAEIALVWWNKIQRESATKLELVKVVCEGEDITYITKDEKDTT